MQHHSGQCSRINRGYRAGRIAEIVFTALLTIVYPAAGAEPKGWLDPVFQEYPFEQWLNGPDQIAIKWSVKATPARLSPQQRLVSFIQVQLDGAELAKRRGRGEVLILVEITDSQGLRYQNHSEIDLRKVEEGLKSSNVMYTQSAFVLPGDYRVAIAIYDSATKEHATRRTSLRVPPMKSDPLPASWQGLPPVEIIGPEEGAAGWYLPDVRGQLNLSLQPKRPLRIELIANLTGSDREAASLRMQDRNMRLVIPALKIFSQMALTNATLNVRLLDLSHRKVAWRQNDAHGLDWDDMKQALTGSETGKIDVKSLEHRHQQAAFFVSEVGRAIRGSGCAVIILANPTVFESGQDLSPIRPPEEPTCPVYYFRFYAEPEGPRMVPDEPMYRHRGMGRGPREGIPQPSPRGFDELEGTLKPLSPRLYDLHNPEQFRKALASLLAELGT